MLVQDLRAIAACTVTDAELGAARSTETSRPVDPCARARTRQAPPPRPAASWRRARARVSSRVPSLLPCRTSHRQAAATSSLVPPYAASSKSWMAALPFIAIAVMARRRIKAISSGPRPTLMTWPPSIATIARRLSPPRSDRRRSGSLRGENRRQGVDEGGERAVSGKRCTGEE